MSGSSTVSGRPSNLLCMHFFVHSEWFEPSSKYCVTSSKPFDVIVLSPDAFRQWFLHIVRPLRYILRSSSAICMNEEHSNHRSWLYARTAELKSKSYVDLEAWLLGNWPCMKPMNINHSSVDKPSPSFHKLPIFITNSVILIVLNGSCAVISRRIPGNKEILKTNQHKYKCYFPLKANQEDKIHGTFLWQYVDGLPENKQDNMSHACQPVRHN